MSRNATPPPGSVAKKHLMPPRAETPSRPKARGLGCEAILTGLWFGLLILARVLSEGLLKTEHPAPGRPLELVHMALWWLSIVVTFLMIVSKAAHRPLIAVIRDLRWGLPVILIPPVLDRFLIARAFDYPYPSGDAVYALAWLLTFMPAFVTPGQKLEITLVFAAAGLYVARHTSGRWPARIGRGLKTVALIYLVFAGYAWFLYPLTIASPWCHDHPDATASLVLLAVLASQIWLIRRDRSGP